MHSNIEEMMKSSAIATTKTKAKEEENDEGEGEKLQLLSKISKYRTLTIINRLFNNSFGAAYVVPSKTGAGSLLPIGYILVKHFEQLSATDPLSLFCLLNLTGALVVFIYVMLYMLSQTNEKSAALLSSCTTEPNQLCFAIVDLI